MALQAWHNLIWGVSPILVCRSSQALWDWMGNVATQLFSGLSRDFQVSPEKSGLWLGHSRTFRHLSQSHSCVILAVYLGSLSCYFRMGKDEQIKPVPNKSLTDCGRTIFRNWCERRHKQDLLVFILFFPFIQTKVADLVRKGLYWNRSFTRLNHDRSVWFLIKRWSPDRLL
jgi:hypothetical protein